MQEVIYEIYEIVGAYFTGTRRRRIFYLTALIFFLSITYFSIGQEVVVLPETLYWIFSTIIQSLVALVALMGIFIIFQLQSISSYEERVFQKLQEGNETPLARLGITRDAVDITGLLENIKRRLGEDAEEGEGPIVGQVRKVQDKLKMNKWLREHLYNFAIKFGVYIFTVVLLCLFFLSFTPLISQYYLGLPAAFLIIFLSGYGFFLTIKGLASALHESRSE